MDELRSSCVIDPIPESPTIPFCELCDCIVLTKGKRAFVDYEDRKRIGIRGWKAKLSRGGWYAYKTIVRNGRTKYIYMHRLIMNCPLGFIVHHRNGNGLDNRRVNLVIMTQQEHEQLSRHLRIARKNNDFP